jgi:PIN domain nuclease of toxin-antitoxin system
VKTLADSGPEFRPLLLDTHVLVWLMFGDTALGRRTADFIGAASDENRVLISAITPWEIGILVSKKRIDLNRDALAWVRDALRLPGVRVAELGVEIAVASSHLPWDIHADPADRILAATARHLGATLVTADLKLLEYARAGHFVALDARR